ncbi:hypothetical protein RQP46_004024 [Phenoliferia psychrophenolica]
MVSFAFAVIATLLALPSTLASCTPFDSTNHANCTFGTRTYLLHRPSDFKHGKAHPLVLSFHGRGGSSSVQETLSQFSVAGLSIGGDMPLMASMTIVKEVESIASIDKNRIYAAGKSNGGGFVNLLACNATSAAVFAAFAPVSAALYPDSLAFSGCAPGRFVPILNSHGTADTTVPYIGKNETDGTQEEPDIMTWRRSWATRNGCIAPVVSHPITTHPFVNATRYDWVCSGAPVIGVTTTGLGHSWPTRDGLDPSGSPNNTASYDLTPTTIIPFFEENPLYLPFGLKHKSSGPSSSSALVQPPAPAAAPPTGGDGGWGSRRPPGSPGRPSLALPPQSAANVDGDHGPGAVVPVKTIEPNFAPSGALAAETNTFQGVVLKYNEPPEARKPVRSWRMYVFKGKDQVEMYHVNKQSAYLFGRDRIVADIPVDHPSTSKQHAVLQFRQVIERSEFGDTKTLTKPFLIDLDSANGTSVNDEMIPGSRYYELKTNDVIKFAFSTREYVLLAET